jgi:hypothetical protein
MHGLHLCMQRAVSSPICMVYHTATARSLHAVACSQPARKKRDDTGRAPLAPSPCQCSYSVRFKLIIISLVNWYHRTPG